jgi:hypothetical protein
MGVRGHVATDSVATGGRVVPPCYRELSQASKPVVFPFAA